MTFNHRILNPFKNRVARAAALLAIAVPFLPCAHAEPGDSAAEPIDLGPLDTPRLVAGRVQSDLPSRYYRFHLDQHVRSVDALLPRSSLSAYVNLFIAADRNGNGLIEDDELLGSDRGYSGADARVQLWLNPGTYLVLVRASANSQSDFQLSLSQTPRPESAGSADDTLLLAQQRPLLQPARAISDFVGAADPVDFHRMEITNVVTEVQALLPRAALTGYATLALVRDANGDGAVEPDEVLASDLGYSGADARVQVWLDPGIYYLRVTASTGQNPNYSLVLATTPRPGSAGRRDNQASGAVDLGPITQPRQVEDFVGAPDPDDFYRFDVTGPRRKFTFLLPREGLSGYARLRLLADANQDSILELLDEDLGYSGSAAELERELGPGRYFVQVVRNSDDNTAYRLVVTRSFAVPTPPFFLVPPAAVTLAAGKPATFTVVADGSGTLAYEWYLDGATLDGETGPSLTLASRIAEVRDYQVSVRVSNAQGTVLSDTVRLQVTPPDVALGIARAVILSWPASGTEGYLLQTAPSPGGPWSFVDQRPVQLLGNRREVAVPESEALGFYRLARP